MELNFYLNGLNPNFSADQINNVRDHLKKTVSRSDIGFYSELKNDALVESCKKVFKKFSSRTNFFHIGIGGSSLGPEMLLSALRKKTNSVNFTFINNIDPDEINDQFSNITKIENCLFYIVSKSGGTSETIAAAMIIFNLLQEKFGIKEEDFNQYIVLCTDPNNGDLRKLSKLLNLETLEVPQSIGGRFSVLSPVGILPAIFAGIDIEKVINAGEKFATLELEKNSNVITTSLLLQNLYQQQDIKQTVLMPYSSKLKNFSAWFVQLWAESLGKKLDLNKTQVNVGFTPIQSYGATDQHSQMQLFVEGPTDKSIFLISLKKFHHEINLKSSFDLSSFSLLNGFTINQLMEAEFYGAKQTLIDQNKPLFHLELNQLDEENLGQLILFFELLTVAQGHLLNIDPFDQPGVESGKIYTKKWLESQL